MIKSEQKKIKILETPRDAMQGIHRIIPAGDKVKLINSLLQIGFDIVDAGSIVSSAAVPQMKDTPEVLDRIDLSGSKSKLLILVGSQKRATIAASFEKVTYIGFPFSTSETFLKKNINSDFNKAWKSVNEIQNICLKRDKQFFVYLTMAFGNPYGDHDGMEPILSWCHKMKSIGIKNISLSDITGVASVKLIETVYSSIRKEYPDIEFGIHLHVGSGDGFGKIEAAYKNGCSIFDGVINGLGGCPMTGFELLGNLPTSVILDLCSRNNIIYDIDSSKYRQAFELANQILT